MKAPVQQTTQNTLSGSTGAYWARCIYLDDLGINCKPAAALGMAALKVNGEDQALAELGALLGMTF